MDEARSRTDGVYRVETSAIGTPVTSELERALLGISHILGHAKEEAWLDEHAPDVIVNVKVKDLDAVWQDNIRLRKELKSLHWSLVRLGAAAGAAIDDDA